MYFMYVDESGDPGTLITGSEGNSPHYVLSGLIVPIEKWQDCFDRVKEFRRNLRKEFGLLMREEIHAKELIRISKIESYRRIKKSDRIEILRRVINGMPTLIDCGKVVNVCLKKAEMRSNHSIKETAWKRLFQRFETFLRKAGDHHGIVVVDGIEDSDVRRILREMKAYNPIPSRFGKSYRDEIRQILEDPFPRDSRHSYFIQLVDCIAHTLYRREFPKGSLKKFRLERLFDSLDPLLLKEASRLDSLGIVRK